jgi:2-C-methyl-D-erythritol 2,4-cyclodiphosphate synthase
VNPPIIDFDRPEMRVGIGYDSHRLAAGRRLVLGGIEIPSEKGLLGHSDADVLLHAITDAMLGAAAKGDIGVLFPPSDPQWRDADSSIFVRHASELLESYGWEVVNVDALVLLERPKLLPYRGRIRASVASMLGIDPDAVGLKAKTGEGVGPVGTGQLAEAHAVVLVSRSRVPKLM